MACVSYRTFSDAVGVTILKLNLTVQDLDQVELGFFYCKKKQNEYCDGYANLCESLTFLFLGVLHFRYSIEYSMKKGSAFCPPHLTGTPIFPFRVSPSYNHANKNPNPLWDIMLLSTLNIRYHGSPEIKISETFLETAGNCISMST